jgi:hypothetical protein
MDELRPFVCFRFMFSPFLPPLRFLCFVRVLVGFELIEKIHGFFFLSFQRLSL